MHNPYQILAVHIQNDRQAEIVADFLQRNLIDYEELQGEQWICSSCGVDEKNHDDEECPPSEPSSELQAKMAQIVAEDE